MDLGGPETHPDQHNGPGATAQLHEPPIKCAVTSILVARPDMSPRQYPPHRGALLTIHLSACHRNCGTVIPIRRLRSRYNLRRRNAPLDHTVSPTGLGPYAHRHSNPRLSSSQHPSHSPAIIRKSLTPMKRHILNSAL